MAALVVISTALSLPVYAARTLAQKKQAALTQYEKAERMREALNGRPAAQRSRHDYEKLINAYRSVYYTAPTSPRADPSAVAVGELLAEMGHQFDDEKALRAAIGQFEFLRREYPGSGYRVQALFTMAQIYADDLNDADNARATFEEFLQRYPRSELAEDARAGIKDLDRQAREAEKKRQPPASKESKQEARQTEPERASRILVTGIRHWSTPNYTRVAIDLEGEVKYDVGRLPNPDRVYFDLHGTRLSSTLKGKSFEVEDGFLRQVRAAQFQRDETRVVLDLDEVSDYSVFLLPNPYRLIIDIHGKHSQKPAQMMAKAEAATPKAGRKETEKQAGKPAKSAPVEEVVRKDFPREGKVEDAKAAPGGKPGKQPTFAELSEKVAKLNQPEAKEAKDSDSDSKPAAPSRDRGRTARKRALEGPAGREAKPTASGERSLIRALGLKIGRIVVDAGHGGHDTGTIGPNGLLEKDLVLDVALRLGKLLQSRLGAEVVYTRDDDTFVPLETRTAIANQNEADLFISIHANSSSDPSARGVETYYLNFTSSTGALEVAARENAVSDKSIHELQDLVKKIALKDKVEESREFAVDVQHALYRGLATRGLRNRGVKKAPFIVLIGANMPSILAEISFVSNPADAKRLRTGVYRQKIAEALYRGTAKYVGGLSGLKVASKVNKPAPTTAASARSNSDSE